MDCVPTIRRMKILFEPFFTQHVRGSRRVEVRGREY